MKIMGHRGARNEAPENTLKGFQHAIDLKISAIELDIHTSSDGELVVIHDETLERTTNGLGLVSDKSLAELKKLDAGDGERIPTLKESLDLILEANLEVQIEIKDPKAVAPLIDLLQSLPDKRRDLLTIIAFDHGHLSFVKEKLPSLKTAFLLYGRPLNPVQVAQACGATGISFNIAFIDQELRNQTRAASMTLTGWNANTRQDFERMQSLELDYLATDCPQELLSWRN